MLTDWLTVVAQVVNFLILVGLLYHFLYDPIIRAMDRREKQIASRLEDADNREQEAREEKEALEADRRQLEKRRDDWLQEARQEADEQRHKLLEEIRRNAEGRRQAWQRSLAREKSAFLRDLLRQAAEQTCATARQVLAEMADAELQERMLKVFRARLQDLPAEDVDRLKQAARDRGEGRLKVRSAFELDSQARRDLTGLLHRTVDQELDVTYETDEDLLCGIEVRAPGHKLGWNLSDRLEALSEAVDDRLEALARETPSSYSHSDSEDPPSSMANDKETEADEPQDARAGEDREPEERRD
jgi:F-type H+-transporting ATPase subunit b